MKVRLVYFAWLRERLGMDDEEASIPENVETVADLFAWLGSRNEIFGDVFSQSGFIQVAIDRQHVSDPNTKLGDGHEIALFPPMTGG